MRIIKRYSNRKLYDTSQSSYVTLDEIAELVRAGEELQIIDNKSGEDLTRVTLAQIVFENEKKEKRGLPLQALKMIVQSPADLFQRIREEVTDIREQTQEQVGRIKEQARQQQEEIVSPIRDMAETIRQNIDDFHDDVDKRLRATSNQLRAPLQSMLDEVHELRHKIEQLEHKIGSALETRRDSGSSSDNETSNDNTSAKP